MNKKFLLFTIILGFILLFGNSYPYSLHFNGDRIIKYAQSKSDSLQKVNLINDNKSVLYFNLDQNFPNPFNPTTTISYEIAKEGLVKLSVYNILGKEVANLVDEVQSPGKYEVKFDAKNLNSGIYFYKLVVDNFTSTKKLTLLK
jgi:hypothetical protein